MTEIRREIFPCRFIKDLIVVWLDSNINESIENMQNSISQLRNIVSSVQTYTDPDECINFITDVINAKVFLVISGSFAQQSHSLIEDINQLESIYIFCSNQEKYQQFVHKQRKMKGVYTDLHPLCKVLKENVRQVEIDLIPISILSTTSSNNINELDPSFMYSQLLKEILLDLPHNEKDKKELVNYCRDLYADNDCALQIVDEFEQMYDYRSTIWWYTRGCFVYSMLNKALRTQDIEIIIKMGFFVRDLHQQIEQLHSQANNHNIFTVFRGQGVLNEEFDKMKKSKGCLLSFNNFLSTSVDRDVSFLFADSARQNPDLTTILFHLKVDPSISSTPFASLDKISYYSDKEQEILFSMHTVFRIGEMKEIEDRLWQVNLTLTNDNDQQLTELTKHMRKQNQASTGMHQMGALMLQMGEFDKAEEIYTILRERIDNDNPTGLAHIHHQLGCINYAKGYLSSAFFHYNQSRDIYLTYLSSDDPQLSSTYSSIGAILRQQGDLDGALEYSERVLNIDLHAPQPDPLKIASEYNNIGEVRRTKGNYIKALNSFECALKLCIKHLPSHHPSVATTYKNIATVYDSMGDKSTALSYLEKTLVIEQKSLSSNHPSLSLTYANIARVLENLHRYKDAVEYAKRAVDSARRAFCSNRREIQLYQNLLDQLQQKL